MKKYLRAIFVFAITFTYISLVWIGLEYWLDGSVQASYSDTVIALFLALQLTSESMKEWEGKNNV